MWLLGWFQSGKWIKIIDVELDYGYGPEIMSRMEYIINKRIFKENVEDRLNQTRIWCLPFCGRKPCPKPVTVFNIKLRFFLVFCFLFSLFTQVLSSKHERECQNLFGLTLPNLFLFFLSLVFVFLVWNPWNRERFPLVIDFFPIPWGKLMELPVYA